MGHKLDFAEKIRRKLAPPIGKFVTGISSATTGSDEFVGYVEMPEEQFEQELHSMGFHRNPLAYWKRIPNVGGEQGSWRMVDGDWQLHVILFEGSREHPRHDGHDHPERTYVYAHWEYRWDRYPLKHLRAKDHSPSKGVNEMRRHLNLASVPFYSDRTLT